MERQIEDRIFNLFTERLKNNVLAELAIKNRNPRDLLVQVAPCGYGIREKSNRNDGPDVEAIQETVGGHSNEAWCMAYVQTCIAYVEKVLGVKSPIAVGEHCLTVWGETAKVQRVKHIPLPGAIAIWRHGNTSNGHTGFVLACDDKVFQSIEGNTTSGTDPNGEIVREGGGVYFNRRALKPTGSMKLVGFLKPF